MKMKNATHNNQDYLAAVIGATCHAVICAGFADDAVKIITEGCGCTAQADPDTLIAAFKEHAAYILLPGAIPAACGYTWGVVTLSLYRTLCLGSWEYVDELLFSACGTLTGLGYERCIQEGYALEEEIRDITGTLKDEMASFSQKEIADMITDLAGDGTVHITPDFKLRSSDYLTAGRYREELVSSDVLRNVLTGSDNAKEQEAELDQVLQMIHEHKMALNGRNDVRHPGYLAVHAPGYITKNPEITAFCNGLMADGFCPQKIYGNLLSAAHALKSQAYLPHCLYAALRDLDGLKSLREIKGGTPDPEWEREYLNRLSWAWHI